MIDLNELFENIEEWGEAKGIIGNATPETQFLKTVEEVGELAEAIGKQKKPDMADAYGDIIVTVIMGASCAGMDIRECLQDVFEIISKRKGKMENGAFVKND